MKIKQKSNLSILKKKIFRFQNFRLTPLDVTISPRIRNRSLTWIIKPTVHLVVSTTCYNLTFKYHYNSLSLIPKRVTKVTELLLLEGATDPTYQVLSSCPISYGPVLFFQVTIPLVRQHHNFVTKARCGYSLDTLQVEQNHKFLHK